MNHWQIVAPSSNESWQSLTDRIAWPDLILGGRNARERFTRFFGSAPSVPNPIVLVRGDWLPHGRLPKRAWPAEPVVGVVAGEAVFFLGLTTCEAEEYQQADTWQSCVHDHHLLEAQGRIISGVEEGICCQRDLLQQDLQTIRVGSTTLPTNVLLIGPKERLRIHPRAMLEPGVLLDTPNGSVAVGAEAEITAFSELRGPCLVGARSRVFRGRVGPGTTIAQNCAVSGEVQDSILYPGVELSRDREYHRVIIVQDRTTHQVQVIFGGLSEHGSESATRPGTFVRRVNVCGNGSSCVRQ